MLVKSTDYLKNTVSALSIFPASVGVIASNATFALTGVIGTALSVLTVGKVEKFNLVASYTRTAAAILPNAYASVVGIFNSEVLFAFEYSKLSKLGVCRTKLDLFPKAKAFTDNLSAISAGGVKKHVVTRGYYALAAIVAVVSRVADLILGSLAAVLSIACLGRVGKINKFAIENLTIFGAIDDLSRGIRGSVNPWQTYLHAGNSIKVNAGNSIKVRLT